MAMLIRNMTKEDISRVGEILYEGFNGVASKYGYASNVNSAEEGTVLAWAMFHHGSSEHLVAEIGNRVVGISCLSVRGDFAGLGPTAIDPSSQDKSLGRDLAAAVLKKVEGVRSVRTFVEAFNPAIFTLAYFSHDLKPVETMLDLYLENKRVEWRPDSCSNVSELTADGLDEVSMYDNPRSKLDRRTDLAYYVLWGKVLVYRSHSEIRGYLACLPGMRWVQLGPLLAEGEEEAVSLFQHALTVFKERDCRTRVMTRDYLLARALKNYGFRLYCVDVLMVRGLWRPSQYTEAFGYFPEGV